MPTLYLLPRVRQAAVDFRAGEHEAASLAQRNELVHHVVLHLCHGKPFFLSSFRGKTKNRAKTLPRIRACAWIQGTKDFLPRFHPCWHVKKACPLLFMLLNAPLRDANPFNALHGHDTKKNRICQALCASSKALSARAFFSDAQRLPTRRSAQRRAYPFPPSDTHTSFREQAARFPPCVRHE